MDDAEYDALMNALTEALGLAMQSIRQSCALGAVLLAKAVVTQAELDEALRSIPDPAKKLLDLLGPKS